MIKEHPYLKDGCVGSQLITRRYFSGSYRINMIELATLGLTLFTTPDTASVFFLGRKVQKSVLIYWSVLGAVLR